MRPARSAISAKLISISRAAASATSRSARATAAEDTAHVARSGTGFAVAGSDVDDVASGLHFFDDDCNDLAIQDIANSNTEAYVGLRRYALDAVYFDGTRRDADDMTAVLAGARVHF